jgi:hypothetical protein
MASNNTNGNDDYALKLDDLSWLPRDWQPSAGLGDTLRVPEASSAQPDSMRSSSPGLSDSVPGAQGEQDDDNMEDIIITNHERDRVK